MDDYMFEDATVDPVGEDLLDSSSGGGYYSKSDCLLDDVHVIQAFDKDSLSSAPDMALESKVISTMQRLEMQNVALEDVVYKLNEGLQSQTQAITKMAAAVEGLSTTMNKMRSALEQHPSSIARAESAIISELHSIMTNHDNDFLRLKSNSILERKDDEKTAPMPEMRKADVRSADVKRQESPRNNSTYSFPSALNKNRADEEAREEEEQQQAARVREQSRIEAERIMEEDAKRIAERKAREEQVRKERLEHAKRLEEEKKKRDLELSRKRAVMEEARKNLLANLMANSETEPTSPKPNTDNKSKMNSLFGE